MAKKRRNKQPRSNQPATAPQQDSNFSITARRTEIASFSGPIPPPAILKAFDEIRPGSSDDIFAMAKTQLNHRIGMEQTVIHGGVKREREGMVYGFILSVLVVCIGGFLLYSGESWLGFFLIMSTVISLAGVFVYGKRKQQSEMNKNIEAFPDKR